MSFSTAEQGERVRIDAEGYIHAYGDVILHGEANAVREDDIEPEYRDLSSWFNKSKEEAQDLTNRNNDSFPFPGMAAAMAVVANENRETIRRDVAERQINFYREMIGEN